MPTRSGITPQIETPCDFHQAIASSRSLVPSRAAQMTTPRGVLVGDHLERQEHRLELDAAGAGRDHDRIGGGGRGLQESLVAGRRVDDPETLVTAHRPLQRSLRWCLDHRHAVEGTLLVPLVRKTPAGRRRSAPPGSWWPLSAAAADRYTDVVVLPTPPLMLETTMLVNGSAGEGSACLLHRRESGLRPGQRPRAERDGRRLRGDGHLLAGGRDFCRDAPSSPP